jgi:signal transduction histidine kinase
VWCEADENQVRTIVWNLATNGLRAMSGGGHLRLSVTSEQAPEGDEWVALAVQDEGCGIPAEHIDGIFQPFWSSFERGTGLGLAIVHRVVTDYNGTINVSSEVGVGTIISVRLPALAGITAAAAESGRTSVTV